MPADHVIVPDTTHNAFELQYLQVLEVGEVTERLLGEQRDLVLCESQRLQVSQVDERAVANTRHAVVIQVSETQESTWSLYKLSITV